MACRACARPSDPGHLLPGKQVLRDRCPFLARAGSVGHLPVSVLPLSGQQRTGEPCGRRFLITDSDLTELTYTNKGSSLGFWAVHRNLGRNAAGPQVRPRDGNAVWMGWGAPSFSLRPGL